MLIFQASYTREAGQSKSLADDKIPELGHDLVFSGDMKPRLW